MALLCCLHNVKSVEVACYVTNENVCVLYPNITWDGTEEFEIIIPDKVTTDIFFAFPFKTKVIPTAIFDKFPHLKSLSMYEVGLETITSDNFVNAKTLTTISIVKNNIYTLKSNSFATAKNLQEIDVSENKITKIEDGAFDGLTELRRVILALNKVVNFDITKFTKLPITFLDVRFMDFTFTAPNELAKIVALNSSVTELHLSHNPIDTPEIWRRLSIFPNLKSVYFIFTEITHVDHMDEFRQLLPNLSHIDMGVNPLDSKWLEEAKIFFSKEGVKFIYEHHF